MAQFDVYRISGHSVVVDIQCDIIGHFETRMVVPLIETAKSPRRMERLHPVLTVVGQSYVLATHLMAAVPSARLENPLTNLAADRDAIIAALDMLVTGI